MSKRAFPKPGNFVYPVPAVMVSLKGADGQKNIFTAAWTGTVCSDPPMVYVSVRKERYSHHMLTETGEFVINLPDKKLAFSTDYCGCTTGAKVDKFAACGLTPREGITVGAPSIEEAPVSIECKVTQVLELGTHDMFLAEVTAVLVDEKYIDDKDVFHMDRAGLIAYEHGAYRELGETLGRFGYSVRKKPADKKTEAKKNKSKKVIGVKKNN
ncbi:flavin reductase family protein [Butyrivibrio sp. MC2013]|uniref:flavin reductase family protein n=1 Tax=Butyrivibrio sp. MC2013 TaxID=1280686 RepID=UPI000425DEFD|nr:flavin reductase family protein [Butyrivibrio sp. MC2013]